MVSHSPPPFQGNLLRYVPGIRYCSDDGFAAIQSVLKGSESDVPKDELRGAAHCYHSRPQTPLHAGLGLQATGHHWLAVTHIGDVHARS